MYFYNSMSNLLTMSFCSSPVNGFSLYLTVNFGGGANSGVTRAEPISLATLDRDCFIIPVHSVDRFLPAGIPVGIH